MIPVLVSIEAESLNYMYINYLRRSLESLASAASTRLGGVLISASAPAPETGAPKAVRQL
jgi:hypothetical protein